MQGGLNMKCHMTSLFNRLFKKDETIVVCRSSKAYSFLKNECKNNVTPTDEGDLIVRCERDDQRIIERIFDGIVGFDNPAYSYFINEYRQNSPVRDMFGNIILSDDIRTRRSK